MAFCIEDRGIRIEATHCAGEGQPEVPMDIHQSLYVDGLYHMFRSPGRYTLIVRNRSPRVLILESKSGRFFYPPKKQAYNDRTYVLEPGSHIEIGIEDKPMVNLYVLVLTWGVSNEKKPRELLITWCERIDGAEEGF